MNNKQLPRSGKKRIDQMFGKIIYIIENVLGVIYKKEDLRDPDDRRIRLKGFLSEEHKEAYIRHCPPDNPVEKNLLHEALHALFPTIRPPSNKREVKILCREEYYWKNFTLEHRRYLRRYIPRHTVKKEP